MQAASRAAAQVAEQQAELRERVRQLQEAERTVQHSQRALAEREADIEMGERHLNVRTCSGSSLNSVTPTVYVKGHIGWH